MYGLEFSIYCSRIFPKKDQNFRSKEKKTIIKLGGGEIGRGPRNCVQLFSKDEKKWL